MAQLIRCVAAGNPNCGKSTLFNLLSGGNATVGNWSGVTVDKKVAHLQINQQSIALTDLPGLLSLDQWQADGSVDEAISRQVLLAGEYDLIINVIDINQLERSLYLTSQLLTLNKPMLVLLNKADVAGHRQLQIDIDKLSEALGTPVLAVSAKQQQLGELGASLLPHIIALKPPVPNMPSLQLAVQDADEEFTPEHLHYYQRLAERRYQWVEELCQKTVTDAGQGATFTEILDRYALSPWSGVPIFLGMIYLTFMFAINVGSAFIDFFDIVAGNIFVDGIAELLTAASAPELLIALLAGGVGTGIQTVATFIPVVAFLYVALSFLEISGYLARAGFVIEGLMQKIGLPGKAFVPLIVGFGCNVPSITATRTLDTQRERLVTAMMAPFMSCGARLPVYALFVAAFFPENGQNIVFLLYITGVAAAIITGLLLRYTLLPGQASRGFIELPDYEVPSLRAVFKRTWNRTRQFVLGAGKVIVLVVAVLSVVNSVGVDGSFGNENSEKSVLSHAAQLVVPLFSPMGLKEDNWPAAVGIVTGLFAKEALVGTLNSLYSQDQAEAQAREPLLHALNDGLATIPENLLGIAWADPMGLDLGDTQDTEAMTADLDVASSTLQNLQVHFVTAGAAFSYLLFILLYTPCAAVLGAFSSEFGNRWALFCALYTFIFAYSVSTLFFQLSQLATAPLQSLTVLAVIFSVVSLGIWYLRRVGQKRQRGVGDIPVLVVD